MSSVSFNAPTCTALTHLITPWRDTQGEDSLPAYYCCINAGVPNVYLAGAQCQVRCKCHEMPEGWRPEEA